MKVAVGHQIKNDLRESTVFNGLPISRTLILFGHPGWWTNGEYPFLSQGFGDFEGDVVIRRRVLDAMGPTCE